MVMVLGFDFPHMPLAQYHSPSRDVMMKHAFHNHCNMNTWIQVVLNGKDGLYVLLVVMLTVMMQDCHVDKDVYTRHVRLQYIRTEHIACEIETHQQLYSKGGLFVSSIGHPLLMKDVCQTLFALFHPMPLFFQLLGNAVLS